MKKKTVKIMTVVLCTSMVFGTTGALSYAAGRRNASYRNVLAEQTTDTNTEDSDTVDLSKDETVYVISDANGNPTKIVASDWLQDHASGTDTYSKESLEKELPVEVKVTYMLDGKEIKPEELAGKSGKVTMRFEYTNKQKETVTVDGEEKEVNVPFVMLTGMILDNKNFSNVQVNNGKIINDGSHSIVVGFGLPGLQENLEIDKEKLELPDYVEVTADTTNFDLSTTMTLATNEVFGDLDVDDVKSLDDLHESMNKLTDAMNQLMDGSSQLYDGLATLLDKSGQLIEGVNKLNSGAGDLVSGANQLKTGAGTLADGAATLNNGAYSLKSGAASVDAGAGELKNGVNSLDEGLGKLTSKNEELNGGAKQVFESLLAAAQSQLKAAGLDVPALTIDNYKTVLNGVLGELNEDAVTAKVRAGVEAQVRSADNMTLISGGVQAAVKTQVANGVLKGVGLNMTYEQYLAAVEAGQISEEVQAQISAAIDAQMASEGIQATITSQIESVVQEKIEENMASASVQKLLSDSLASAKNGATSVKALIEQLDSYNTFYEGLQEYTAGVATAKSGSEELLTGAGSLKSGTAALANGANSLADGTDTLTSGANSLYAGSSTLASGTGTLRSGIGQLASGGAALTDGVTQLKDGAMTLSDGLKQFNEEGIEKLVDIMDNDVDKLAKDLRATVYAAQQYKTFVDDSAAASSSVKFIYKTAGISKED